MTPDEQGQTRRTFWYFPNPCILEGGTPGPAWALAPLDRGFCYHAGTKGFSEWWCTEGQRQSGMVWTPGNLPPHRRAAPRGPARQERSTAKRCASQLPPRAPTDCQSGGARSQDEGCQLPVTTLANCQSGEAKVPFWELRTAWPAVIPGASVRKSTNGHSSDS